MKLNKDQVLDVPVMVAGAISSKIRYSVKILDCVAQGEHFFVYLGEDAHGTNVCLKTIRYRSEKKELFSSAADYIVYRRKNLLLEQQVLTLSHPGLPEPLAMLVLENDCAEDQKLFRRIPEWERLRQEELILVEEFFSGLPLHQLTEQLKFFSLDRRLGIVLKIARMCRYCNENGFIIQNLHPSQIMMSPENDDNVYLVGLHNGCPIPMRRNPYNLVDRKNAALDTQEYRHRSDLAQFGMLLYFLITLHDPGQTAWHEIAEGCIWEHLQPRVEKALKNFPLSSRWLLDLMHELLEPIPEFRVPDWETVLSYFDKPPYAKLSYKIQSATPNEIRLEIDDDPAYLEAIQVQLEIPDDQVVNYRRPYNAVLKLPGLGIGEIICAVAGIGRDERLTWWQHQKIQIFPELQITAMDDLAPDKFGFRWQSPQSLAYVQFHVLDSQDTVLDLGQCSGTEIVLPPANVVLPFYKKFRVRITPYYQSAKSMLAGPIVMYEIELFPPIPEPVWQYVSEGIQFILQLPKRQAKMYEEGELLHNDWPLSIKPEIITKATETWMSFLLQEDLDVFEQHSFAFRVLLNRFGWRTGPKIVVPATVPSVQDLVGYEEEWGSIHLKWRAIQHSQLICYQIACNGEVLERVTEPFFGFPLPLPIALTKDQVEVSITAIYSNGIKERTSPASSTTIQIMHSKKLLSKTVQSQVTPFSVTFSFALKNPKELEQFCSEILLQRRGEAQEALRTIAKQGVQSSIVLTDNSVTMGKTYQYSLNLGNCRLEKTVTIPEVNIVCSLQHVGYEDVVWEIQIPQDTANYIQGQLEVLRTNESKKQSHLFTWSNDEGVYYYEDKELYPGTEYHYTLIVHWQGRIEPYYRDMGTVTTKEFQLTETIEVFYNRAVIHWVPSPMESTAGIEGIEIYDNTGRFIALTKSDSITLENLEPQREYCFPLKYRYSAKKAREGKVIYFKTTPYEITSKIIDVATDALRISWEISDLQLARRVKEFLLQVSGIAEKCSLSPATRSIYLKQLYPGTEYTWQLWAQLKSGHTIFLGAGKAMTQVPTLQVAVENDLVQHLTWDFPACDAIDKIEIYRNNVLILQTADQQVKEVYDSEFKPGEEILYQFYYLLKDERRVLAAEKKVKALRMQDLFDLIQQEIGIGAIRWDYNNLKKLRYLKYIELYRDNRSIDKKGGHLPSLVFDDLGDAANNEYQGLPPIGLDYRLDIVGVAPTGPKCKKKWSILVRNLQCEYADLPENFSISPEHCCIYFDWDQTNTPFLQEICLRRSDDSTPLYQGGNQAITVYDDNHGAGLDPNATYAYILDMAYKKHRMTREFNVTIPEIFEPTRLDIQKQVIGNVLKLEWNSGITTSIVQIGWRRIPSQWFKKTLGDLFQKWIWTSIDAGLLIIPLSGAKDFYYQLVFEDRYGHCVEMATEKAPEQ